MEAKQYFSQIKTKPFSRIRHLSNISIDTKSRNGSGYISGSTVFYFKDQTHIINKHKSTDNSKPRLLTKVQVDIKQYQFQTSNSQRKLAKDKGGYKKVANIKNFPILPEVALINSNREKLYKLLHSKSNSNYDSKKKEKNTQLLISNLQKAFDSNFKLELSLLNKNKNNNSQRNQYHHRTNQSNDKKMYHNVNRLQHYNQLHYHNPQSKRNGINYGVKTQCGSHKQKDKINQDNYLIFTNVLGYESISLFGIFDGHGPNGHLVSKYLVDFFINHFLTKGNFAPNAKPNIILQQVTNEKHSFWKKLLCNAEKGLSKSGIDTSFSGSTGNLIMIIEDTILCINTGDSRAILIDEQLSVVQLSRDHKPELTDERHRINSRGGIIDRIPGTTAGPFRVWVKGTEYPGIAMSRSIGDKIASSIGVICEPEITQLSIKRIKPRIVIIASDGIWEYISNEAARELVMPYYDICNTTGAANHLLDYATQQWINNNNSIDDITIIVLFFPN